MQKTLTSITVVAALTALVAVGWALTREPAPVAVADAPSLEDHQRLVRRVVQLEEQLEALRQEPRDELLVAAPAQGALASAKVSPRERLRALVRQQEQDEGALTNALEVEGSQVRQKVQDIVRDEMEIRREERDMRRRERMKERLKQRVTEFAQTYKLSERQQVGLEQSLTDEREQIMAMFEEARRNEGDFDKVRQQVAQRREQTDQEVQGLLSGDALKDYQERRAEEAARFQRGPGGRRGGF